MSAVLGIIKTLLIGISLVGAAFGVLLIIFDGDIGKIKKKFGKQKDSLNGKTTNSISDKKKAQGKKASVEAKNASSKLNIKGSVDLLNFDGIRSIDPNNPVGIIVREGTKEFVGVMEVFGLNYNLLSLAEREILEDSFSKLLNGIDYPVQIYIQSRSINIDNYQVKYEKKLDEIRKDLEKFQAKIKQLKENDGKDIDAIQEIEQKFNRLASQYEYGLRLNDYILFRCKEKEMLERRYYICISHSHNASKYKEKLTEDELVANAFFDISNKSSSIISALQRAKLNGKLLSPVEVGELLYIAYNKKDSNFLSFTKAMQSRFNSNWITTAEPIELKIIDRQLKELDEDEKQTKEEIVNNLSKKVGE